MSSWKHDDNKQEFSYTLEKIKDQQHLTLLNKGLSGEFNASITKLMLHNYGYSDKQKIETEQPVKVVTLNTHFLTTEEIEQMTDDALNELSNRLNLSDQRYTD